METQRFLAEQTLVSRRKDFDNPFRQITFDTPKETAAVLGDPAADPFVRQTIQEAESFAALAQEALRRG